MRFLTRAESIQAVHDIEMPAAEGGADRSGIELQVDVEGCLSRSAASARLFARLLGVEQRTFLWITEFGIWPSLENQHLFERLRKADNELRPLYEVPGQVFGANEQDALVSYLQLVIVFGWGGVLLGFGNQNRLIVSHDSWVSMRLLSDMPSLMKAVGDFGLPHHVVERPHHTLATLGLSPCDGSWLPP